MHVELGARRKKFGYQLEENMPLRERRDNEAPSDEARQWQKHSLSSLTALLQYKALPLFDTRPRKVWNRVMLMQLR